MSNQHENSENLYAYDIHLNEVFVGHSEGGRHLYSCMGCRREVNRVRHESYWYFRHVVPKGCTKPKCTFSDETFRHKLAKDILQRLKRIKAPTLYKFPPNTDYDLPRIIKSTHFIEAHVVRNEVYFYENDDGELKWGKKDAVNGINYLIRADSAFFDKNENPILIIEFVATNKLSAEKKAKIRMLGIDTLRVSVPKDSPEAIEQSLIKYTDRTKWIYSNEERNTEYISLPQSFEDRIHGFDGFDGKFFEESYKCRKARINNLIFRLGRCVESEHYREIENFFAEEIQRIEKNTETNRRRLKGIREGIQEGVDLKFKEQVDELEQKEREFNSRRNKFKEESTGLEARYINKRSELKDDQEKAEQELQRIVDGSEWEGGDFEARTRDVRRIKEDIKEETRRVDGDMESARRRRSDIPNEIKRLPEKYREIEEGIRGGFERNEEYEKREIEKIRKEENEIAREYFVGEITEIRRIEDVIKSIKSEEYIRLEKETFTKLGIGHSDLKFFNDKQLYDDFAKEKRNFERLEIAIDSIRSGTYKSWDK